MRTPIGNSVFGQEYIPVGVCSGLDMKCDITSSYGILNYRVNEPNWKDHRSNFFLRCMAKRYDWKRKVGSMHFDPNKGHILSSGIVASQIPAAIPGIAICQSYKNLKNGAVCFFGDGAVDSGGFWESVNLASLFRLPIVFFLVAIDNEWAVHTPKSDRRGYKNLKKVIHNFDLYYYEEESIDKSSKYFKRKLMKLKVNL